MSRIRLIRGIVYAAGLCLAASMAIAEPTLGLSSVQVLPGEQGCLRVSLTGVTAACAGVNATLAFPTDVSVVSVAAGDGLPAGFAVDWHQDLVTKAVGLIAYSDTATFSGGTLMTLTVEVAANAELCTAPVTFCQTAAAGCALSNADGSACVLPATDDGAVIISASLKPGDVDLSGLVNAVDVQLVINGALGISSAYVCDINGDGFINAVDVQLVINAALGIPILVKTKADAPSSSLDSKVFEPVFPRRILGESRLMIGLDAPLAIRLRSDEPIDFRTIWGVVASSDREVEGIDWLPVGDENSSDGWAIYWPENPWLPGDVVSMYVSAATITGKPIGPIGYEFVVESAAEYRAHADKPTQEEWQPDYSDYDASCMDLTAESNEAVQVCPVDSPAAPPEGIDAIGFAYELAPDQVYEVPQRVWLPVPSGADINDVALFYYYTSNGESGWYPAHELDGWLVSDSYLYVEIAETRYLGFLVRHAGTVQLGMSKDQNK